MHTSLGIDFKLRTGRGFKTDVDKLVMLVRGSLCLDKHQRMAAGLLAGKLGMKVKEPADVSCMTEEILRELTVNAKDRWSAVLLKHELSQRRLIINNPTHTVVRKESNIFHEISHDLCMHEPDEIEFIGGLPMRRFSPEKEAQAETLGFALHLPRECLFWAAQRGMSREDIGAHFCASSKVVTFRINSTGIERILKRKIR